MVPSSILRHYEHCERIKERVYQGALPSSYLRYLNKAVSLQIYKKYSWQCVSNELAICGAPGGAKSATACTTSYML